MLILQYIMARTQSWEGLKNAYMEGSSVREGGGKGQKRGNLKYVYESVI